MSIVYLSTETNLYQVVTAFTIIFVTIMTTVTRRYALYQAQQGAYITDLEQLQASISLPSTIKMVFSLRKFTKFSASLVFLWCFYYLGSQASKREYAYAASHTYRPMLGLYPATRMDDFLNDFEYYSEQMNRDFLTYLTTYDDLGKLPTYGIDKDSNTLLPNPSRPPYYLLNQNGTVNVTKPVKIHPSQASYLTDFGRPLYYQESYTYTDNDNKTTTYNYWDDGRLMGDYTLYTSYIKFDCWSLDIFAADQFPMGLQGPRLLSINITSLVNSTQNASNHSPQRIELWRRWDSDTNMTDYYGNTITAPNIGGANGGAIRTMCDIFEPRIKADVHCTETACLVTKMSSQAVSPNSLETTIFSNVTFANIFFNSMLSSEVAPKAKDLANAGQIASYFAVSDDVIVNASTNSLDPETKQETLDSQTSILEMMINTYLNLGERQVQPFEANVTDPAGFEQVRFIGAPWEPHYAVFWQWIAIDYVSGLLLLAAAFASFWLRRRTLIPDIFGFVSSLTRDNPHFPVLPASSTLDGITRTRAMRNVRVRIGDIGGPNGEVGRIGFVPVNANIPIEVLSRNRQYV